MADPILDAGEQSSLTRRLEQDASGRAGSGFTAGFKISASSFKSLINKFTGGESDAKVQVGFIDVPRDGDQAIQKLQDHYQRGQIASDGHESHITIHPRKDEPAKKPEAKPELPEHIKKNMEKSIAQARERAKEHGLEDKMRDGGDSSPTDRYAHGAPKKERAKGEQQIQSNNTVASR